MLGIVSMKRKRVNDALEEFNRRFDDVKAFATNGMPIIPDYIWSLIFGFLDRDFILWGFRRVSSRLRRLAVRYFPDIEGMPGTYKRRYLQLLWIKRNVLCPSCSLHPLILNEMVCSVCAGQQTRELGEIFPLDVARRKFYQYDFPSHKAPFTLFDVSAIVRKKEKMWFGDRILVYTKTYISVNEYH